MRRVFPRCIGLLCVGTLAFFAGGGNSTAQTANQAHARNGQASDQTKTQDGQTPASASSQPLNKKQAVFSRHNGAIPSVAFSPDGKRLASAGGDVVKVTDLETGKELLKLKSSRGMRFNSVAFSPDGRTLVGAQSMLKKSERRRKGEFVITTLFFFGEVLVWDSQTGEIKTKLNDDNGPAWALAFSSDGKWLAVGTGPTPEEKNCANNCPAFGEITLWETSGWKLIRRLRGNSAAISVLAISTDGRLVAGGGGPGANVEGESRVEIFLWDASTGELKQKFPGHTSLITSLAFAPDSHLLASAGRDRNLKIWDCRTYELRKTASDHVLSLEERQTLADAASGKSAKDATPPVSWLNAISFSRDGKQIIGGSRDSIIRFYDSASAKIVRVLKPQGWPFIVSPMPFYDPLTPSIMGPPNIDPRSRGGDVLRSGVEDMRRRWQSQVSSLNALALAPDGETLAIGNADGKIRVISLK